jgi:integrase
MHASDPPTVQGVIDAYLAYLEARVSADEYSPQAFADAARDLGRFGVRFGAQTIDQCRRYDVTQWLQLNPQWRSNATKRRVIATLLGCFNWAEDEELIDRTPYRRPRKLKLPTTPRREATEEEYVALMRARSRALRRALFFLRRTGARTKEMRELSFDEINFEAAVVEKERHKTRRSTGQARLFGLEPCVLRFLRNLYRQRLRDNPEQRLVFLNAEGTPWDRHTFARHLRRWAKRIGLDVGAAKRVSAYCIRHSYCTWAIEAGVGERQVAAQMGHADTRMIGIYSKAAAKKRHVRDVAGQAVKRRKK